MKRMMPTIATALLVVSVVLSCHRNARHEADEPIRVVSFFTARHDLAHVSFVKEAHQWFFDTAPRHGFSYDSTSDWSNLNSDFLSRYDVVIFLDSRPEDSLQRVSFREYMNSGGGWIGFHFAGFALTPSDYPQNWDWYHNEFLGAGQYKGNTWRPTSAVLRIENPDHPITKDMDTLLRSAPNEWYSWQNDIAGNDDIAVLLSIDTTSFPLGTGPKENEIWKSGYYPVVWTNKRYKMVYFNMGHNDMDYDGGTNKTLSSTFSSKTQNQLIANAVKWVGRKNR